MRSSSSLPSIRRAPRASPVDSLAARRISARTDGRFIWSPLIEGSGPLVQHILQHGEASVPPEELAALEAPPSPEIQELEEELGDLARATFSLLCTDGRATCSRKALVQAVRASGLCAPARAKWLVEDTLPGGQEFFDLKAFGEVLQAASNEGVAAGAAPAAMSVRGGLCRVLDDVRKFGIRVGDIELAHHASMCRAAANEREEGRRLEEVAASQHAQQRQTQAAYLAKARDFSMEWKEAEAEFERRAAEMEGAAADTHDREHAALVAKERQRMAARAFKPSRELLALREKMENLGARRFQRGEGIGRPACPPPLTPRFPLPRAQASRTASTRGRRCRRARRTSSSSSAARGRSSRRRRWRKRS